MKPTLSFACSLLAAGSALAQPGGREVVEAPFLGVESAPVTATLSEQLGLPAHTGLVVQSLAPDGPSANVLKVHDILTKLDDQILIDPYQFAVLVRMRHAGESVALTYLRGGKPATASVKLGEHALPKLLASEAVPFMAMRMDPEHMQQVMERVRDGHEGRISLTRDDGTNIRLELDGKARKLTITGPDGHETFSGPATTAADRKALPPEAAAALAEIEKVRTEHPVPLHPHSLP